MALVPSSTWSTPAECWKDVVARYVHFRRVKAWKGRVRDADGRLHANRITKAAGLRLSKTLEAHVDRLLKARSLPVDVQSVTNATMSGLVKDANADRADFNSAPKWLRDLWRAIVFNRDAYTCRYCHRSAWDAHAALGATLRLELDHRRAKSRLGTRRNDFSMSNIALACHSCNTIKGQMTPTQCRRELESLAASITQHGVGG